MTTAPAPDALAALAELVAAHDAVHAEVARINAKLATDRAITVSTHSPVSARMESAWAAARAALTRDQGEVARPVDRELVNVAIAQLTAIDSEGEVAALREERDGLQRMLIAAALSCDGSILISRRAVQAVNLYQLESEDIPSQAVIELRAVRLAQLEPEGK